MTVLVGRFGGTCLKTKACTSRAAVAIGVCVECCRNDRSFSATVSVSWNARSLSLCLKGDGGPDSSLLTAKTTASSDTEVASCLFALLDAREVDRDCMSEGARQRLLTV